MYKRLILLLAIFISLVLSFIFSLESFTGYVVSDISDGGANLSALVLLILGVFGSFIYIKNFRMR
jgi:uncharacterized membrane protein